MGPCKMGRPCFPSPNETLFPDAANAICVSSVFLFVYINYTIDNFHSDALMQINIYCALVTYTY